MNGVALLCDMRGSRDLDDRSAFGARLRDILEWTTRHHREDLLTRLQMQAGIDEFGAVIRPGSVGAVVVRLWQELQSVPVRYALADGPVDVLLHADPDGEGLHEFSSADGPALHRASDLLDELRSTDSLFGVRSGAGRGAGRILSTLGEMTYLHLQSWTERQAQVFFTYRRTGLQTETARRLEIDQSTVSRTLARIEHRPVLRALDRVEAALDAATAGGE